MPSVADWLILTLWPVGLFFAVWGLMIGWRRDRLAKAVALIYGVLGVGTQVLLLVWLVGEGNEALHGGVVAWVVGTIPANLSACAIVLSLMPARNSQ